MFNQIVTAGGINTSIKSRNGQTAPLWYGEVSALSDPSNIALSLKESGLTYRYALSPIYNSRGDIIDRMQKLITIDANGNRSDDTNILFKDHAKRRQWNKDNPLLKQKPEIRRHGVDNFLSIVGKNYQLHQPEQVYKAYLELANYMGLQIHMAGVINNGHSVWARVKIDDDIEVKDAKIERYITILTGVSKSTKAGESPQDVACFNQWNMLLNATAWSLGNISHRYMFNPQGFADSIYEQLNPEQIKREITALVESPCNTYDKHAYFKNVLFADFNNKDKLGKNTQKLEHYIDMVNSDNCRVDAEARRNTWYGAFMDATYIADRFPSRDMYGLGSGRASSNLTGTIGKTKSGAYVKALNQPNVLQALAA